MFIGHYFYGISRGYDFQWLYYGMKGLHPRKCIKENRIIPRAQKERICRKETMYMYVHCSY